MAVVTLLTIDLYLPGGLIEGTHDLDNARTAGFTVLVFAQLFNCFNARSEDASAFRHLFVNPWLWGAIALSVLLQVAVVNLGFLNVAFGTVPLELGQWLVCAAMASVVLWVERAAQVAEACAGGSRMIALGWFVLGIALLIGGTDLVGHGGSQLVARLGVTPIVVGLTIVSIGTSTPELAVGVEAAVRSKNWNAPIHRRLHVPHHAKESGYHMTSTR